MRRTLAIVILLSGCGTRDRGCDDNAECISLLEVMVDLARRELDDKDYKRAMEQAERILRLDPVNPQASGIREQARTAIKEIETSVELSREAAARGDLAQAAIGVERVMARDPGNPIVAQLSSQLNASFSARAATARSQMENALALARAKAGAVQEGSFAQTSFAEGARLAAAAAQRLKGQQFTTATQTYLQARDAYDRARRAIEAEEREKNEMRRAQAAGRS